jgi:hypothetical protein
VRTVECTREDDVLEALTSGRWPEHAAEELHLHVAGCQVCTDLVDVAGALLAERGEIAPDAQIPSSAVMWWRAQMRARQEAARDAARPITIAQMAAVTIALTLVCGLLYVSVPWVRGWLATVRWMSVDAPSAIVTDPIVPTVVIVFAGLMLLLTPVAVYFAVREDRR